MKRFTVPFLVAAGVRVLSGLTCFGMLVLGFFGFFRGLAHFNKSSGVDMWLMSSYLILFSTLGMLAELGRPERVIDQFNFLKRYGGRGIFFIFLGSSLIIEGSEYQICKAVGGVAVAMGIVECIFACPFAEVQNDIEGASGDYKQQPEEREVPQPVDDRPPADPYAQRRQKTQTAPDDF